MLKSMILRNQHQLIIYQQDGLAVLFEGILFNKRNEYINIGGNVTSLYLDYLLDTECLIEYINTSLAYMLNLIVDPNKKTPTAHALDNLNIAHKIYIENDGDDITPIRGFYNIATKIFVEQI